MGRPSMAGCETNNCALPPLAGTTQMSPPETKAISLPSGASDGSLKAAADCRVCEAAQRVMMTVKIMVPKNAKRVGMAFISNVQLRLELSFSDRKLEQPWACLVNDLNLRHYLTSERGGVLLSQTEGFMICLACYLFTPAICQVTGEFGLADPRVTKPGTRSAS